MTTRPRPRLRFVLLWATLLSVMMAAMPAAAQQISVIPQPVRVEAGEGLFVLRPDTVIFTDVANQPTARLLVQWLASTDYRLSVKKEDAPLRDAPRDNVIILALDASLAHLGGEGYALESTPQRVVIRAAQPAGVFYGVQTLRQLLAVEVPMYVARPIPTWQIPVVKIEDAPRFPWRGAMMDSARHFMPKWFVLKFIDLLALYKMNTFHWHLTDDQGWRIEIKKYPRLTEVGAWRSETRLGHEGHARGFDKIPHGGFYSQDDIREVVAYARERFITIVPEIEMPGHAQAAIAAYYELGNTGGPLEVWTRWGVNQNIFNPSEKTIRFLQDVLDEVIELFPGTFIHIGGDEVPKDQWKYPDAQARLRELGLKNEEEMQSWFIRQMEEHLRRKGRRLVGWDEILEGGLPPGATVMSWRGMEGGIAAARAGHDVVMAPTSHTYLDYYQSQERGEPLAIGGFLPLEKVYEFDPVPPELTAEEAKHILGGQCQLWSEYLKGPGYVEYMAFPRLLAVAEAVWTPKERKDLADFLRRVEANEPRLRQWNVNYRPLTLPSAR